MIIGIARNFKLNIIKFVLLILIKKIIICLTQKKDNLKANINLTFLIKNTL